MKKTSPNVSYIDRIRSLAHGNSTHSASTSSRQPPLPLTNQDTNPDSHAIRRNGSSKLPPFASSDLPGFAGPSSRSTTNSVAHNTPPDHPEPAPPPQVDSEGHIIEQEATQEKKNIFMRFWLTLKSILFASYVNVLLVFVPIGIAAKAAHLSAGIIFGMNAIAIIPLAGLLSHATESVAKRMGDTVGALMNVTFGNAVELIILYVF